MRDRALETNMVSDFGFLEVSLEVNARHELGSEVVVARAESVFVRVIAVVEVGDLRLNVEVVSEVVEDVDEEPHG